MLVSIRCIIGGVVGIGDGVRVVLRTVMPSCSFSASVAAGFACTWERRVEVDEVHRFREDFVSKDVEVVAVVEVIHPDAHGFPGRAKSVQPRRPILG